MGINTKKRDPTIIAATGCVAQLTDVMEALTNLTCMKRWYENQLRAGVEEADDSKASASFKGETPFLRLCCLAPSLCCPPPFPGLCYQHTLLLSWEYRSGIFETGEKGQSQASKKTLKCDAFPLPEVTQSDVYYCYTQSCFGEKFAHVAHV